MTTLKEYKEENKRIAKEIRNLKSKRKESRYGFVEGLNWLRREARYRHVAYCMARGRKYEEIERNPRDPMYLGDSGKLYSEIKSIQMPKREVINEAAGRAGNL